MSKRLQEAIYTANLLRGTREYLSDPDNWTVGLYRTEEGYREGSRYGDTMSAPQVCAIGGVCKVAGIAVRQTDHAMEHPKIREALDRLLACASTPDDGLTDGPPLRPIFYLNDRFGGYEDVLALFDLAIEEQCKIVREEAAKVANADQ